MSLLIAEVDTRSQLLAIQRLVEVYFTIKQLKYCQDDIILCSYYCLFGANKNADHRMKTEHYFTQGRTKPSASHAIHQIRSKLKKLGILVQDVYTLELDLHPELKNVFEDTTKLGCLLKFSFQEAEAPITEEALVE